MLKFSIDNPVVVPKKGQGLLPVLIVLFLISYGLLSFLVVEQGRTIDSQRFLIHDLFADSTQLNAMKMKGLLRDHVTAHPQAKNNVQTPSAPQAQSGARSGETRSQRPALQKPPRPTADTADSRRIALTI